MQITLKSLKEKDGCANGIIWFEENFGEEAESEEIIKNLRDIKITNNWMFWLFSKYKLSGLCEGWHDNGQLHIKENYKDGKRYGLSEWWYNNGQFLARINYKDGEWHGLCEWWYSDGQLEYRINYKDDKPHGLSEWWKNGQVRFRANFKDGQLICRENYKDGKLIKKEVKNESNC